jgi:hypothetical protein
MNVDGGGLYFESDLDNEKINAAIGETLRRIQGLSDGTVAAGKEMDDAFQKTADDIEKAFQDIDKMTDIHQSSLRDLEDEYARLGEAAANAFMSGKDDEYRVLTEKQHAIKGEIAVRKELLKEIGEQADALAEAERKMEAEKKKVEENANAHVSMRTRIKELKEEMMLLIDQGIDEQSEAYKRLVAELGRLQDIQGDVAQQGRMLANDEQQFQGIITGLSGMAGGFSAVTGTISLFAGENENLQKIMVKVQSLMAITIGLQQVSQALNKDSAFQLVTLNGLKEWWNGLTAQATATETAETAATVANTAAHAANTSAIAGNTVAEAANTVATGGQAAAATAGTVANIGLAGAFRMVGLAIKSIPVFGWILAGISGLIALYSYFSGKAKEAAKAQEEFNNKLVESCFKPIASIESLSKAWDDLGDNLDAKKKFVEDYQAKFKELGVSVKDVADAENLLVKNKQAFIDSLMAKAKAAAAAELAQEKYKEAIKKQLELEKQPKTVTRYYSNGMYGGGGSYEIENPKIKKLQKQHDEYITEANKYFEIERQNTQESYSLLQNAEIKAVDEYAAGTVGAIEQAIAKKREALKLIANAAEYKDALKVIENLEKDLRKITGKKTTGGGSSSKDPFLEKLEKQKKEYQRFMKWVNSGDEALVKAANKEFEGLLKQGSTYIDNLKKQREIIESVDVSKRTKAQNAQLRTLNNQIAEETKKTVLEAFNTELSEQLNNAKSVMQMLNIIEQKRKELKNDGTELDNNKKETLDDAEKDVVKQAKEETDALLDNYASYLDKKIKMERQYTDDMALLRKRLNDAQTDAEKKSIQDAMDNRTKQHNKDIKNDGDSDYSALLKDYATFEQKKQAIIDDYDEKRQKAVEHNNQQLVDELNKAQAKALSNLAIGEMQSNPDWEKMFGNLDELTTKKLEEILALIEGKTAFLGVEFDPKDLETIKKKVQEIKGEIKERNPFKSLISGIKDYSKATDDESKKKALTNMFESASGAIDLVSGSLDAVVGGMAKMGIQMDEETQAIIGDIGGILDGASQLASGIATGNPLGIIQGGIGLLTSAFDLFNSKDRKAEKQIKKHAEAIGELERTYNALSWAIDKALGGEVYKNQQAAVENMKTQQQHLLAMQREERSKKKTDNGKIKEWQAQYEELGRKIEDMLDAISNDILQTDAKTFANELGDALVSAFAKGESAADAFGETVDNVIKQAVLNQLKKNFLEKLLQGALDGLEKSMGYWNGDEFVFDGLSEAEIAAFKNQVANITSQFNQAMNAYSDIFKDVAEPEDPDTSLTGSVKGVSEETASLVAGQMNAIRINQMEATAILRQQLIHMATIAQNTAYNRFIESIYIHLKQNGSSNDTLRSQGLS